MSNQQQTDFKGTKRFLIKECLGSGGFGTVYKVYDQELNTFVALKVLHQRDAEALYNFKQEFRFLADITHPNLVNLYELVLDKEQWFFTMELVQGIDFLEYVRGQTPKQIDDTEEPETVEYIKKGENSSTEEVETIKTPKVASSPTFASEVETIKLKDQSKLSSKKSSISFNPKQQFKLDPIRLREALRQLAEGINALHKIGKLHRDIKPSNVLVTKEGRVVILDFGIATELTFQEKLKTSDIVGTPAYMSPEQSAALPLSEATDWYSVGVILYETLTGKRPFTGQAMDLLAKKQQFEAKAPSDLVDGIPLEFDQLCQQLLKRDPYKRPLGQEILHLLNATDNQDSKPVMISRRVTPFIGREDHLSTLMEAFNVVKKEQRTAIVYIEGRSGMGKSALVRHFLEQLRLFEKNIVVLTGRCYEQESVPYKALDSLVDALSNYLRQLSKTEVKVFLSTDVLALARLFPVLNQVSAIANSERSVLEIPDSQELRRRAFTALRELLGNLASKVPLILYIDDLQWGDLDSAGLLSELLRPPDPPAFLLITTYRSEDVKSSPLLTNFLPLRTKTDPKIEVKEIAIKELSQKEAQKLAITLLGKDNKELLERAERIAQESKGSPFFVDELVRYIQTGEISIPVSPKASTIYANQIDDVNNLGVNRKSQKSASLEQEDSGITKLDLVIYARVMRLSEEARRLLEVVAVAGQPLERLIAKKAAGIESQEQSAFALLRSNRMIRVMGTSQQEQIETYHDRIRETIIANLDKEILKDYHYKLAILLESASGDSERLSIHFYRAGKNEQAAKYAINAADNAYNALAFERAANLYKFALELHKEDSQTHNLQVRLAESIANVGKSYEAAKAYLAATKTTKGVEALKLHQSAADQFLRGGFLKEGFAELRVITDRVGIKIPKTPLQALLLFLILRIKIKFKGLDFQESNDISSEDLLRLDTFWTVSTSLAMFDATRGIVLQSQYLLLALKVGDIRNIVRALASEAGYAASAGGRKAAYAKKLLRLAGELAESLKSPNEIGMIAHVGGIIAGCLGEWRLSVEEFTRSESIFRQHCVGTSADIDRGYYWIFNSYFFIGDLNLLFNRLPEVLKDISDRGNLIGEINLRLRTTYIKFLADDEIDNAKEELEKTIGRWSKKGFQMQHFWHLFGQVQTLLYEGNSSLAWQILNEKWPTITKSLFLRIQSFYIQIHHLRARCAIALLASNPKTANSSKLLSIAKRDAKLLEKENMPWANAFAKQILASIAALEGEIEKAISLTTEAERGFEAVDMMLYKTVLERRRGELMANAEGKNLVEMADKWISNQQIKKTSAIANMLVPGKWHK
ncbi:MAG: protein kinase [Acidobacteria bacterium]|nr:protein kinase [Acidobacteriota bacterium]